MADRDHQHDDEDEDDELLADVDEDFVPYIELGEPGEIAPENVELDKIPRGLWEQVLAPLHRQQRVWIARQVADERLQDIAMELAFELDMADADARNARDKAWHAAQRTGYPLPLPPAGHAVAQPTTQVNIRLRRDDHARLAQAAAAVGLRPTTLARALVLNGAAQILREHAGSAGP